MLDCTLRDGGYINDFLFGEKAIKDIIHRLSKAAIDIIECGFLQSKAQDPDASLFGDVQQIQRAIGKKNENLMYVAMIQYGAITNEEITPFDGQSIDGIRLTFHQHEIEPAFVLGKQLMDKGYKVFMQPVGTTSYEDGSLIHLIQKVNELKPFAFYMVDTLGVMYKNDLLRLFYIIDHNLDRRIALGFHSHNNLQMSFANAQELVQLNSPRKLIIDASVLGMGRGAGNLNTELLTQYLNVNFDARYDNLELMGIVDEYIRPLSFRYKWGYDVAYYMAAVSGCHPNYASFLLNLQTLNMQDINAVLKSLDVDKRALFHKEYIEQQYLRYMDHYVDDSDALQEISRLIGSRKVLLMAPGKSIGIHWDRIKETIERNDYYVVSINFQPKEIPVDMIYISNLKRFKSLDELQCKKGVKIVTTSNIVTTGRDDILVVNYSSYLNDDTHIVDNGGLMCINLLYKLNVNSLLLAGFDGFSGNVQDNYYEKSLYLSVEEERLNSMNAAIVKRFAQLVKQMDIQFITESFYEHDNKSTSKHIEYKEE
ncbi:MAG: aldolase catalytic domain-containing protein [Acetatifactor muris]|nr:aldolase catalytic domain-containing protein [Acetatifactor muris]MCM1526648.1 aldolase catalytic domain-containing protein [Bacteroides sp.]